MSNKEKRSLRWNLIVRLVARINLVSDASDLTASDVVRAELSSSNSTRRSRRTNTVYFQAFFLTSKVSFNEANVTVGSLSSHPLEASYTLADGTIATVFSSIGSVSTSSASPTTAPTVGDDSSSSKINGGVVAAIVVVVVVIVVAILVIAKMRSNKNYVEKHAEPAHHVHEIDTDELKEMKVEFAVAGANQPESKLAKGPTASVESIV